MMTTSSGWFLIFDFMNLRRCFWFMHEEAWTWVSTWSITYCQKREGCGEKRERSVKRRRGLEKGEGREGKRLN